MAKFDPERVAHKAWLGPLQPVGVVVSPPALTKAQAVLDRNILPIQQAVQAIVQRPASVYSDADPVLLDFPRFAREVLGWSAEDLAGAPGGPPVPEALAVALPNYGDILRPTYAALDSMGDSRPLLLIQVVDRGAALDKPPDHPERSGWHASPQARLELLLRDTGVPAGLLLNGCELRLVYAPRGESSGHIGFPISEMCGVSGRTFLSALHMLLSEHRVFSAPDGQRLLDLLVPVWINLDYLSAEEWVSDWHALPSPHPRLPLVKHFFFPGFTRTTGGLLRERDLPTRRQEFADSAAQQLALWNDIGFAPPPADTRLVSLFAYDKPAISDLLGAWEASPTPICCLAPLAGTLPAIERPCREDSARWRPLPARQRRSTFTSSHSSSRAATTSCSGSAT